MLLICRFSTSKINKLGPKNLILLEFLSPFPLVNEIWIIPHFNEYLWWIFGNLILVCHYIENLDQHNSEVWFCEILVLSIRPRRSPDHLLLPLLCEVLEAASPRGVDPDLTRVVKSGDNLVQSGRVTAN